MAIASKIELRTLLFIEHYKRLKHNKKMPPLEELAGILGIKSKSSISEILGQRQNIQPIYWEKFKKHFKLEIDENSEKYVPRGTELSESIKEDIFDYKGELIHTLKDHNRFLQKMLESSLTELVSGQKAILANAKAVLQNEAWKAANGNSKKFQSELDRLEKIVIVNLGQGHSQKVGVDA